MDARTLNWRFVVPDEPDGLLLLPIADESFPGAVVPESRAPSALERSLAHGPFPAVVVPDLGGWRSASGGSSRRLLEHLASAVRPGGWIYAGFGNPWFPTHPGAPGTLRTNRAVDVLRRVGYADVTTYLAFPSHRCPAYLVAARGAGPLEYFLRRLAFPYVERASTVGAPVEQRALRVMRRVALVAPHTLRLRFAPAAAVVARRPA